MEREQPTTVNERLGAMHAEDRIGWALGAFDPKKIVLTTSGGETSAILPTLMSKALRVRGNSSIFTIVFVDTLLYGQSTLDFVQELHELGKKDGYAVRTYQPRMSLSELTRQHPDWTIFGSEDFETAKNVLKQEPLERALQESNAHCWASGPMRWETLSRANMPIIEARKNGLYAFHPIADWTQSMAQDYIETNNLPTNSRHNDFFKGPNQSLECGIHIEKS